MSYSKKGMLALLRDLLEHDRRHHARLAAAGSAVKTVTKTVTRTAAKTAAPTPPRALTDAGWPKTSSFDLATASGDAHGSTATGSPLLGEQLPALRAELDRGQGLARKG
jgi:hypothetical protein